MSEFEYYMKEDVFHNNHTTRHGHHQEGHGKETTMTIDRPLHKDSRVTTKYYSEFDEYLMENKTATEPIINGYCYQIPTPIPVKMPKEEVIAKLEAHCVSKKKKYNSWSNTSTVTYSVPSTFEMSVRDAKDSNFVQRVNPTFSMINGKLYDRDYIYERNYWTSSDLRAVCPLKIPQPLLKNSSTNTVDKKLVPLKISSLSSNCSELNYYRGTRYEQRSREAKPHQGILQHDTVWSFDNSRQVVNDLFIDLGTPQQVTHIGTVGSYPPTVMYPAPPTKSEIYKASRQKAPQDAHKYNTSVLTVEDPCYEQSWPVSYRLFYKNSPSEEYRCLGGQYRANVNSHGLVVNDVSQDLAGLSVRFLMLKIVSSNPYRFRNKYNHPVRMSVAVYGREAVAPKPKVLSQFNDAAAAASDPAIIKYTLSIPNEKPGRGVEVKQARVSHKVTGGGGSKHMGKRCLRQSTAEEAEECRASPLWDGSDRYSEEGDHCNYTSGEEVDDGAVFDDEEQLQLDLLLNIPISDSSFWDPVIPYSNHEVVRPEDESEWPALPTILKKKPTVAVTVTETAAVTAPSLECESTDSEHTSSESGEAPVTVAVATTSDEVVADTDSVRSDDNDWMFV